METQRSVPEILSGLPLPRCCRTHELQRRFQLSEGGSSPLTDAEHSELEALHAASAGDGWLVIIGGEHGGIMRADYKRSRPGAFMAGHCSVQWVGRVYAALADFFGRSRTIVVAQVSETLEWLRTASADEASAERLAGRASLLPMLRSRLADVERDCARLLRDGGADYDGAAVHAGTVLDVLTGEAARSVPQSGVRAVTAIFVSHGHAHPTGIPDAHEWYMHMPHPVPEERAWELYATVSHTGFESVDPHPDWDWGAPKHHWRLYSQMLFQAYHAVLCRAPRRRLALLYQFCLSGGAADFMRKPGYQQYCGTVAWPVLAMTTAGRFEPALGSFVGHWTAEFAEALRAGGDRSLGCVYERARARYWEENPELLQLNQRIEQGGETEAETVGTLGIEVGIDGTLLQSMDALPVREVANVSESGRL